MAKLWRKRPSEAQRLGQINAAFPRRKAGIRGASYPALFAAYWLTNGERMKAQCCEASPQAQERIY